MLQSAGRIWSHVRMRRGHATEMLILLALVAVALLLRGWHVGTASLWWDELVQVLAHHIQVTVAPEEQAALYVEMGDVFHQGLRAVDRAVNTYHRALELDPSSRAALHALGLLYERSGNWPFALEVLQREADVCGKTQDAVALLHRMGRIQEDMMQDLGSARSCYEQAIAIDAGHLPSLRSLKGIQEQERDCDLVVVGKHGRNAVEDLLLGSATNMVIAQGSADVLVSTRKEAP